MTAVQTRYSEIASDVTVDIGQPVCGEKDVSFLERRFERWKRMLVRIIGKALRH